MFFSKDDQIQNATTFQEIKQFKVLKLLIQLGKMRIRI